MRARACWAPIHLLSGNPPCLVGADRLGIDPQRGCKDPGMTASSTFGVRSMVAPLRRVLVVRPTARGDFAAAGWRAPAASRLAGEHEEFCALLAGLGVEVVLAAAPEGL